MEVNALIVAEFMTLSEPLKESYYDGGYPTFGSAIDSLEDAISETFTSSAYGTRKLNVTDVPRIDETMVEVSVSVNTDDGTRVLHRYTVWYANKDYAPVAFKYELRETGRDEETTVSQLNDFKRGEYRIYKY